MLRWTGRIISALLAIVGLTWVLQGLDILGGSYMSGDPFWAGAGLILMVLGVPLFFLSLRRSA
jgi:hypothetical protein